MSQSTKLGLAAVLLSGFAVSPLHAQSVTSGDIQGIVSDQTGALVPNATVTVVNTANGETKTATTTAGGAYRVSLLSPGNYTVTVNAAGFGSVSSTVTVSAGNVSADDVSLKIGTNGVTVEVTTAPVAINTENGDVTTAFDAQQIQNLPNPGNDLTSIAQTAPGSVMNTGGQSGTGYGNFSSFGISGLSNMFTLDGGYENDPFLNLNNTGASNLTLGNNEVDTVTIISPAYSAQFGGLGGAQVNEISRSGTNHLHGNASYYWSGRALNANDWFDKEAEAYAKSQGDTTSAGQNVPQFVNANQWAAAIGGPILRDKLFFYVGTEGLRVTTPTSGNVYAPSQAFENCTLTGAGCTALNAAAVANCEPNGPNGAPSDTSTCVGDPTYSYGSFAQAPASQVPLLTKIFNTYNTSPYRPATVTADPNDVSAVSYHTSAASFLSEWQLTARLDYNIGKNDTFFVHYKQDKGMQPTYVDLVSPLFSATSPQPAWEGQMSETHTFSPNIVNQLVVTGNYYSAPFQNTNNYLPVAPFTAIFIDGDLGNNNYGGIDYDFPQGRRVTGYQVIDDLSINKGRNSFRVGYNLRRDDITDLPQVESIATVVESSVESFGAGQSGYEYLQRFPQRLEQPVAVYDMGAYLSDTYKVMPNLTITAGIRLERNSNPKCITLCLQTLANSVTSLPTGTASTTVPYNAAYPNGLIAADRRRAFKAYQLVAVMPRVSFAYQPFGVAGKTVVRGGFGMFSDTFPGLIADDLLSNAPGIFHAAVYGQDAGYPSVLLDPSTAGSAGATAVASNAAFQTSFNTGGTYTTTKAAVAAAGGLYSAPSFTTTAGAISYPTYEEYSLAVEQQLDRASSISVTYVGNHGYHEPVGNGGYNLTSTGKTTFNNPNFFPTVPTVKPVTPFATITNYYSGASSNFNGVVFSAQRHSRQITFQVNYQYSKALDEISNGGLEAFGSTDSVTTANPNNLHAQYGPADYNVSQNTTGSAVWEVPVPQHYRKVLGGFQIAATIFHQTGLPYTILQSTSNIGGTILGSSKTGTSSFSNGTVNLFAREVSNNFDHHCGGEAHALRGDQSNPNPCNFSSSSAFTAPTNFTQQGRNSLTGPSYTDSDVSALKTFDIPHLETGKIKLGAQFFNVFNHPNFQNPDHTLTGTGTSTYGAITSTVSSPTNIFGSVGANASPRLIQLKANLVF